VVNRPIGQILVWFNGSMNLTRTTSGNCSTARGLFVTTSGDIYIDNGFLNGRVEKWTLNTNSSVPAMYVGQQCFGLFIDINDILYCTVSGLHQVVTKPLNSDSDIIRIIAGTGCAGATSSHLNTPHGIFVSINFDLYVADYYNNRIQQFQSGQLNGTTVAGNGSLNTTITLNHPTGIVLDADNYLFIVDKDNNRIIGSGPNGFRCLVACSGVAGSGSSQLNAPQILSFDTHGNMFVTEWYNNRIQKFLLLTNSCGEYENIVNQ
jgi:hypothetical protein